MEQVIKFQEKLEQLRMGTQSQLLLIPKKDDGSYTQENKDLFNMIVSNSEKMENSIAESFGFSIDRKGALELPDFIKDILNDVCEEEECCFNEKTFLEWISDREIDVKNPKACKFNWELMMDFAEFYHNEKLTLVELEEEVQPTCFEHELSCLLNKFSLENESNTPDYILAEYLVNCLNNFNNIYRQRTEWHSEFKFNKKQD